MALLEALLGKDNPFAQWAGQNSNLLGALGAGIAAGPNLSQGIAAGLQNAPQAKAADQQMAQQSNMQKWLAQAYPQYAGLPPSVGLQLAIQSEKQKQEVADPASTASGRQMLADQYGLTGDAKTAFILTGKLPGANDSNRFGNSPVFVRNDKGEWLAVQPGSDGSSNVMKFPEGFKPDPGALNSDRAAGTAYGQAQGKVQFNLPAAQQNVEAELANIQALRQDKAGMNETFGAFGPIPQQMLPATPTTPKYAYKVKVDQIKGQNFLAAYDALRGAGAITEQEGQQARAAMARLDLGLSGEEFDKALTDLENILKMGYDRMSQQANMGPYQSGATVGQPTQPFPPSDGGAAPGGGNVDDILKKYGM